MYIFSKNLMLQTTSEINKQAFASADALQAMLQVGDAIKINDGMGEDIYRYTAYPINTTKSGKFTYTSNILKIQEKAGKTIYYCNFNVPTNEVSLSGSVHFSAYKNNNTILYVAPNEKDGVVYDSSLTALNPQPTYEEGGVIHTGANLVQGDFELQPAATKVGNPTEEGDGVYSNINNGNYIRTTDNFAPGSSPWEICFMFNLDSYDGRLFGAQYDYFMDCQFYENRLQILMSYFEAWEGGITTDVQFDLHKDYWLKFGYTGSGYYAKYSTTGVDGNYIDCGSSDQTAPLRSGMGYITFGNIAGHGYISMNGKLGFNGAYYKIGDTTYMLGEMVGNSLNVNDVIYDASAADDIDSEEAEITTFADQDNADVTISVDQDEVELTTEAGLETVTSAIEGFRNCHIDNLSDYTTIKLQSNGENKPLNTDFLVKDTDIVSLAQVYNNKLVKYETIIANQNVIRKKHNFKIDVYELKEEYIASNFNDIRYVAINPIIPSSFTDIDIIIKAQYNYNGSHNNLFARASNWFGVRSNGIASMYLQQWIQGQTAIQSGVDYFWRLKNDGNGNFVFYTLVAGDYDINNLPTLENWTAECSTTINWLAGQQFYFSYNSGSPFEPWNGQVNISQSRIYVDGNVLFDGSKTSDWTNHSATITTISGKGDLITDATMKFYGKTATSIDTYSEQVIDYEVSKTGYISASGNYTIPKNNIDNCSYTKEILLAQE